MQNLQEKDFRLQTFKIKKKQIAQQKQMVVDDIAKKNKFTLNNLKKFLIKKNLIIKL